MKYALWQNFDDLYIPPVNTYPNQVRSDVKDYLNNFGDRLNPFRQFVYYESEDDLVKHNWLMDNMAEYVEDGEYYDNHKNTN